MPNYQATEQRRQPPVPRVSPDALRHVLSFFEKSEKKVWGRPELHEVLVRQRDAWELPPFLPSTRFLRLLEARGKLHRLDVVPADSKKPYSPIVRYSWGDVTPFQLGAALRPDAYLSHGTAVYLHGLTHQIPKTLYVNKEQSDKHVKSSEVHLSQKAIDRAFTNRPRTSNYVFQHEGTRFVLLSGKNTGRLEVSQMSGPLGEVVAATKLERTLIDIAVRPAYAGGVFEVLAAYQAAKERAALPTLLATLTRLGHAYPYHQAIGFYLEQAGYDASKLERLRSLGLEFDFYLTNQIHDRKYSKRWRLFYPEGM
jgi:hypothetical protein